MGNKEETLEITFRANVQEGLIKSNFEELKAQLYDKVQVYKNTVYDDENALAQMRSDRAMLNKLQASVNERKKAVKELYMVPLSAFEEEVNELIRIIKEPADILDAKIKDLEQQLRDKKGHEIRAFYEKYAAETGFSTKSFYPELLGRIFDKKWLNRTTPQKTYRTAIKEAIDRYLQNIEMLTALDEPELLDDAIRMYEHSLDITDALTYINQVRAKREEMEKARIRAEEEAKAKAAAELEREKQRLREEAEKERIRMEEEARTKAEAELERERVRIHQERREAEEKARASAAAHSRYAETIDRPDTRQADAPEIDTQTKDGQDTAMPDGRKWYDTGAGQTPGMPDSRVRQITKGTAIFQVCSRDRERVESILKENKIWYRLMQEE